MNNKRHCPLWPLLQLVICSGLQLPNMSMDCRPCSCQYDPQYGGTLAKCSYIRFTHVTLPEPGNITTLLLDHTDLGKLACSDFKGMSNIRHLSVKASIREIEEAPGVILTNLEHLDLSRNFYLGFPEIIKIMSWLRKDTLKTLLLDFIVLLAGNVVPLNEFYCRYLQHSALKEIHLDGNVFTYIGKNCWPFLSKTIEVISIRYTMVSGFDSANLTGLLGLTSLRSLDVTGFETWNPGNGNLGSWRETVVPPILPMASIEVLRFKGTFLKTRLGRLSLLPLINNLTTIDLSENMVTGLIGPFQGFGNLEKLDLSNNIITSVSTLVSKDNKLKFVNFSNNFLGQCLERDTSGDILKQFLNLTVLDISMNGITFAPQHILKGSIYLRYLNISGNRLTNFDVDITHMRNLQELNLKNNKLNKLPSRLIDSLNLLPDVKVIIDENPLICSCDTLEFLQWMRDSKHIQDMDNQTCSFINGSSVKLHNLDEILFSLHEICKSDIVLIASSVSGAFIVLLLVSGIMVYRHRWKLRYLYHVGRNRYHQHNEDEFDVYQYDAFISYAETDRTFVIKKLLVEIEENCGMNVCIHHRDFLPGDAITDNIVDAIQNSRKTVIVLSPAFLRSEWCTYEFHIARVDGVKRKLNNILVILLEEVDMKQLPKDLALMMTTNSYLEYSTDLYGEPVFWYNLAEGIKTLKRLE